MNPDGLVDAFVSTIMLGVLLVVAVYLLNPDIGKVLIDILPGFIELIIYTIIIIVLVSMISQMFE
ncbi:hypothetical protein [Haloarcula nitratireducens]|uniref:Uncharacterized protein n=1 Tax=Haloarcula nitratireducens TaxID=2487749 RepID=A0AAW4PDT4_9EURY|nr:hypothetical protein [Halomicroarcula nitratireducens]MBX0295437.1 hypothetical protein [Halomicroarcula nitratireducens]